MLKGFTFPLGSKDVFVETKRKERTQVFAMLILKALNLPDRPGTRQEVLDWLRKATYEETSWGCVIKGKDFTICDPEDKTILIHV